MHFVLIDFNNIFFRAFFIGDKIHTINNNYPIGAACTFIPYITSLIRTLAPTHIALLRDMGKQTWRHQLYPAYKQNRTKTDPELSAQFCLGPFIAEYLEMPLIGFAEYEADDCIATLAIQSQKFANITIVSTDKDLLQLINDKIRIFNPNTKTFHQSNYISEKFQIKPQQMRDYLSLIGDNADNLPGIPGIGPKGAIEILQHCHTTADIYLNLPLYKPSLRSKLLCHQEQFKLMHKLIGLSIDIPSLLIHSLSDMDQYKCKQHHITNSTTIKEYLTSKIHTHSLHYSPPLIH